MCDRNETHKLHLLIGKNRNVLQSDTHKAGGRNTEAVMMRRTHGSGEERPELQQGAYQAVSPESCVLTAHKEEAEKHAPYQAEGGEGGCVGGRGLTGEPELVGWRVEAVPRITNLARRGWLCPRP